MNDMQFKALTIRNTDVAGAIQRLCNSEKLYETCILEFLEDPTAEQLNYAVSNEYWDDAFTAAHALKGIAGNLGFIPLMHSSAQIIVLIRRGQLSDLYSALEKFNSSYRDITDGIRQYFKCAEGNS